MPKVGEVDGIDVEIKIAEHGAPHVHAWYQGFRVKIYIRTLTVEKGGLPPRRMSGLKKWIKDHQDELLAAWNNIVLLKKE